MGELISIIMPAYNCEKYIEQAVESVREQTYGNWELLILNDASTDGTKDLILQKTSTDKRIHYIENEKNMGVSRTRNRGVQMANGNWIAFLDSDDMWEPRKLERQTELLRHHQEAELIFTGSAFIDEESRRAEYVLHVPGKIGFKELLKQNVISCSSVLVKKEYLLKYTMPDDRLHEDYTVWLRILQKGKEAYGIDEPLLIYRISSKSKSGNKINAAKMQMRVYRFIGLNLFQTGYYMCWYAGRNLKKYWKIRKTI